jgi:molybdopterin molybdotransferase
MSEPDVSDLLSVAQAIAIIDAVPVEPRVVELPLREVEGLRLAEDVRADRDYPPFDKSLMDGFAVRSADVLHTPAELRVVGEVPAGRTFDRAVGQGQAVAIMTGAPMPPGADGIVPVEDTERVAGSAASAEASVVRILRSTTPGRFIARRGSDAPGGALVLPRGTRLGPAQLGVAASVGAGRVRVFDPPSVGVLATGDEIVPIDRAPGAAEIRNSNSMMLASLLRRLGCAVRDLGVVPDQPERIRNAVEASLKSADALFVTGGMSMGEYDFVPRILRDELRAALRITKLRIKPGKPFVFATHGPRFIFGLPGNPVSGFVCTLRLAARLLARLAGGDPEPRWLTGPLTDPLPANGPREFYQPAVLEPGGGVRPLQWKGSADVYTLAAANSLLVRGENEPARPAGHVVRVMEIPA